MSRSSKPLNPAIALAFAALILTILGAVFVPVGLHVRGTMADGTKGTFTPVTQHCERVKRTSDTGPRYRDECSWNGRFQGGDTVIDDARLRNDLGTSKGDAAPGPVDAVLGSNGKIYLDSASSWAIWLVIGGVLLPTGLGLGVGAAVSATRRRRRRTGDPGPRPGSGTGPWSGPDAGSWSGPGTGPWSGSGSSPWSGSGSGSGTETWPDPGTGAPPVRYGP